LVFFRAAKLVPLDLASSESPYLRQIRGSRR
jgi:hypothetical protein